MFARSTTATTSPSQVKLNGARINDSLTPEQNEDARIAELNAEIARLQDQLQGDDPEKIVSRHHELLHQYNETKDATQFLIGKLASHKETTIKQLHSEYDLPTDD